MQTEIAALEQKIDKITRWVHQLVAANRELREQLATSKTENQQREETLMLVASQLETLLEQFPPETELPPQTTPCEPSL